MRIGSCILRYLPIPSDISDIEWNKSHSIAKRFVDRTINQREIPQIARDELKTAKNEIRAIKKEDNKNIVADLKLSMCEKQLRLLSCAREKGSFNWLSALPIKNKVFYLDKSTF